MHINKLENSIGELLMWCKAKENSPNQQRPENYGALQINMNATQNTKLVEEYQSILILVAKKGTIDSIEEELGGSCQP